ncbi:MAG: hypothetical protein R3E31_14275 [Chloroflexota bacterium]
MIRALHDTVVLGVTTNIPYLLAILEEEYFCNGRTSTNYLAEHMATWQSHPDLSSEEWLALAALELLQGGGKQSRRTSLANGNAAAVGPWTAVSNFRNV